MRWIRHAHVYMTDKYYVTSQLPAGAGSFSVKKKNANLTLLSCPKDQKSILTMRNES